MNTSRLCRNIPDLYFIGRVVIAAATSGFNVFTLNCISKGRRWAAVLIRSYYSSLIIEFQVVVIVMSGKNLDISVDHVIRLGVILGVVYTNSVQILSKKLLAKLETVGTSWCRHGSREKESDKSKDKRRVRHNV
jgi:hypothetical protein